METAQHRRLAVESKCLSLSNSESWIINVDFHCNVNQFLSISFLGYPPLGQTNMALLILGRLKIFEDPPTQKILLNESHPNPIQPKI